jgi:hypothetical protein
MGAKKPRAIYKVTFNLEVELTPEEARRHEEGLDEGNELIVEEAVEAVLDEELATHRDGGTRCGLHFGDVTSVQAVFDEVRK